MKIPLPLYAWFLATLFTLSDLAADDGYRLWLRYDPLPAAAARESLAEGLGDIVVHGEGARLEAARDELERGLAGLLGGEQRSGARLHLGPVGALPGHLQVGDLGHLGAEGYRVLRTGNELVVTANTEVGVLYGSFALLRHLQTEGDLDGLPLEAAPRIDHRLLNHWDNLTGTVERGQAGESLWDWFELPDYLHPRYVDYARANASLGINGTVLTNVNANATILLPEWLEKVAALADVFRPYGLKVYLTARFSAPIEIGGLPTADPLDAQVQAWWADKAEEIYALVPDFGGFLVKANSEGQPGPQDYGRTHADGANMLADALAPHGGIVMWRAFVYTHHSDVDRHKQAYDEFVPFDGEFRDNVVIQTKNGAIDFMPREPFHPMFGAMPETPIALELQITQEYLGGAIHLAYLGPLFEEALDADTLVEGPGSTVARVVDSSLQGQPLSVIAGVANIGDDRNWTGHPLAQANWYAFGRLAWDHQLESATIAREWVYQTFADAPAVEEPLVGMLMESREAVVDYSMPLGLHHIMAQGHHYGPGPWVDQGRADWTSVYYHRADAEGIGFDRTPSGTNALEQYAPAIQEAWGSPATIPPELLLWFHHVSWDYEMPSGRTLWEELGHYYQRGVETVREWRETWAELEPHVDAARHDHVAALLARQEREAIEWKDACLLYFQTFADLPWPSTAEPPLHSLEHYKSIHRRHVPGDPAEH